MTKTDEQKVLEIATILEDGKASDVVVLDVSELNSWTNYFIICTVTSAPHWQGLFKAVKDYIKDNDMSIHTVRQKTSQGNDWNLIDLGFVVVHLMSQDARSFYELEKLWHAAKKLR